MSEKNYNEPDDLEDIDWMEYYNDRMEMEYYDEIEQEKENDVEVLKHE